MIPSGIAILVVLFFLILFKDESKKIKRHSRGNFWAQTSKVGMTGHHNSRLYAARLPDQRSWAWPA
jgi:hypothetical protein